ncbi:acetyltransferase [Yinghuangia aomiensis]|uniref:Acetyltransferase n=1 Tax=Yinghuangia aomiensis TaxID=676205 RepID=A0ABP9IAG9_9ACTN
MPMFVIGTASGRDISTMRDWAIAEGWDQGFHDHLAFAPADPHGFLIGRLKGEPVACISAVRYGTDHGFIGYYIVLPEARGKGYGLSIFRSAMDHLSGRLVGLDSVPDQQDNYRTSGFRTAWENIRFAGRPSGAAPTSTDTEIVDAAAVPFADLAAYDARFFPAPRDAFLSAWTMLPGHTAVAALHDGRVTGFGVIRPSTGPWRVGPLHADSPGLAATVLAALSETTGGDRLRIDVPETQTHFIRHLTTAGMTPISRNTRMYTGEPPAIDSTGIYGITNGELG